MAHIRCPLNEAAHISPNQAAIVCSDGALLYTEVEQCVCATAQLLQQVGCKVGDCIGLLRDRDWKSIILLEAILRLGGRVFPMNPRMREMALEHLLRESGCRYLVANKKTTRRSFPNDILVLDADKFVGYTAKLKKDAKPMLALDRGASLFAVNQASKVEVIQHSVGAHYYGALGANAALPLHPGDRWLTTIPMWRPEGVDPIFRCFSAGATMVISQPRQDVRDAVGEFKVTHLSTDIQVLASMMREGLSLKEVPTLKVLMVVNGHQKPELLKEVAKAGFKVYSDFSIPEMLSPVTLLQADAAARQKLTPSRPLRYREISFDDSGAMRIAGGNLFMGYVAGSHVEPPPLVDGKWFPVEM